MTPEAQAALARRNRITALILAGVALASFGVFFIAQYFRSISGG